MNLLKNNSLAPKNVLLAGISFYERIKLENSDKLHANQVSLFENPLYYDDKIYDCLKFTVPAGEYTFSFKLTSEESFNQVFIIDDKRKLKFLNRKLNDKSYAFTHRNFSKRKEQTFLLFFCSENLKEKSLSKVVVQYNIQKAFKFNEIPEDFNLFLKGFSLLNSSTQA